MNDDKATAGLVREEAIAAALVKVMAERGGGAFDESEIRDVLRAGYDAAISTMTLEHGVEARTFVDGPFDRLYGPLELDTAVYDYHASNQRHEPVARLVERHTTAWATKAEQPGWRDPRDLPRPGSGSATSA
jgi:hypothetical protein